MELSDIRRENLRRLMNERFGGRQGKIADALDKSPTYISRCLSLTMASEHRKNIGEDFAREIEVRLGLSRYYMDQPADGSNAKPYATPREQAPGIVLASLKRLRGKVTPRSLEVIKRIELAAQEGRLKEEDLVLLEGIAARFEQLNTEKP